MGQNISLITLTGDRPEAFALCQRWMTQQTRKYDEWIVVDDGKTASMPVAPCTYIRREPQKNDPAVTLLLNLKLALEAVTGDYVMIAEDDEWYAPTYIETMAKLLDQYQVVGIGKSKYYHLAGGYHVDDNMEHASLAQTVFRKEQIPLLQSVFSGNSFIDMRFWKKALAMDSSFIFDDGEKNALYVGMKGLPGRHGIGSGHSISTYSNRDNDRSVLKRWIPKDYQVYLDLLKHTPIQNINTRSYEMGMYKATKAGWIPGTGRVERGEIFSWDGPKGSWMEPLDGSAEAPASVPAKDIYQAAAELAKHPPSVLNHIHNPNLAPVPPADEPAPVSMGPKGKVKRK